MSKRKKNLSMDEFAKEGASNKAKGKTFTGGSGKIITNTSNIRPIDASTINTEEDLKFEKKIKEYNENIENLNPLYTELEPTSKILVRCKYLETYRSPNGLIIKPTIKVKVPTQSGQGIIGEVESPYAYSKVAIIVSVPKRLKDSDYRVGRYIVLNDTPLKARKAGKDYAFDLPFAFCHPDYPHPTAPTDVENEHFGYLLIPTHEIDAFLN